GPPAVQVLLEQAEFVMGRGGRSEALAAAAAAGASPRADFAAFNAIGQFLGNAREFPLTPARFDRAVAAAPQSVPPLVRRALLHRFLGNFALAARDYEAILTIS